MLGGRCVECLTTNKLEFDHIEPEEKAEFEAAAEPELAAKTTVEKIKSYFEANKDKFLVEKTKDTLKIEYTDIHFSPELILIFNSVKIPFDLIYFKHIIFHKFEKTIDVTFDTHTRCDKEVSTDICNYIFYKLEI